MLEKQPTGKMMKFSQIALIVLLSFTFAFTTVKYVIPQNGSGALVKESVYDRVIRTKKIRCGYIVNPPYLLKDANTGVMSGLAYEYVEALGRELALNIEWTEETGWGTFHEGLNSDRYDVMCVPVWQSGERAKVVLLTSPLYYNSMYAYARADDDRFDQTLDTANNPNIRAAVLDGDITQSIRRKLLPLAQEVAATQMNASADAIMNVATKKADILFEIPDQIDRFNANSPDKLKAVAGGKPVRLFADVLAIKPGEFQLKAMLDSTIEAVNNDGTAALIIKKFGSDIIPVNPGYLAPNVRP